MQRRKLEELNLMDDFLFNAMLTHPETGEKFTHTILKLLFNRDFINLKVSAQKLYAGMNTNLRGARLDVCIEGDCVDIDGEDFGKLKHVYVIFICNYDLFGYDRVWYTIKNRCLKEPEMDYEDGAATLVLYTRGTKGKISEELRQFLNYMENTDQNNAVNDELKDIQKMVDTVKRDGEVSLRYMKSFEHDQLMYEQGMEQGRLAERKNTERERRNTEKEKLRADMAQSRIKELEAELRKYKEKSRV